MTTPSAHKLTGLCERASHRRIRMMNVLPGYAVRADGKYRHAGDDGVGTA
jgi:hypothetical protein